MFSEKILKDCGSSTKQGEPNGVSINSVLHWQQYSTAFYDWFQEDTKEGCTWKWKEFRKS